MSLSRILLLSTIVAFAGTEARAGYQAIQVYGTGVSDDGSLLAGGALDPHYTVTTTIGPNPGPNAYVVSSLDSAWAANTTTSQWINSLGYDGDQANGEFFYTTTFNLSGLDPTTASLEGQVTADDQVFVFLNGQNTGISLTEGSTNYGPVTPNEGYGQLYDLTITSGFQSGLNTLEFVEYNNFNGPAGLQVSISGTANAVPEPASLAMVGFGLVAVGLQAYRRRSG